MYYVAAGCVGRMFCNRNYPDRLYSGFFRRTLFVFLFQNVGFTLSSLLCNQLYPDTGTYGALEKKSILRKVSGVMERSLLQI